MFYLLFGFGHIFLLKKTPLYYYTIYYYYIKIKINLPFVFIDDNNQASIVYRGTANKSDVMTDLAIPFNALGQTKRLKHTKKIAQKVHPDKVGGSEKAFKELRQAVNNCDIDEILRIAAEHDIDIEADESIDMHKFYLDGINKLEKELQMKRATVAFQWWNGDDETKKRIEESIVGLYGQKDENV